MSENLMEVRLRAQTGELRADLNQAGATVEQVSARMREAAQQAQAAMSEAFGRMRESLAAVRAGFAQALGGMADGLRDAASSMPAPVGRIVDALMKLPGAAKLAGAALSAVFVGARFAQGAADTVEQTIGLARVMGTSTNVASQWRAALDGVGASQSELEGIAKGMGRQLGDNEEKMNALGLRTRDASGNLRPMNELMLEGIGVVNQYRQGADQAQVSQELFGRGLDASSKLLLINQDTMDSARGTIEQMNLEIGENAVAAWKEFDAAGDTTAAGMRGISHTIGGIMMPVIADLTNAFNSILPAAITVVKGALGGLATAFHLIKNGVVVVWQTINAFVTSVAEPIRAVGEAVGRALMGDFSGAAAAISGIGGVIKGAWTGAMGEIEASSQKTRDRIGAIWNKDTAPGKPEGESGDKTAPRDPGKGTKAPRAARAARAPKAAAPQSRSQEWDAELAELKAKFQEEANAEGSFRQFSKAQELQFWKDKLALTTAGSKEQVQVRKKAADLQLAINKDVFDAGMASLKRQEEEAGSNAQRRLAIIEQEKSRIVAAYGEQSREAQAAEQRRVQAARQAEAQINQIRQQASDLARAHAADQIDAQAEAAQADLALGRITREQLLALEAGFEARRNGIKRQALAERLALIDPDTDPVKAAEIKAQIEQLEIQHQARMRQIKTQIGMDKAAPGVAILKSMEDSFAQAISAMVSRAQTLRQALSGIFKSVFSVFTQEMVSKPLADMAKRVVEESALYKALAGAQVAAQGTASGAVAGMKAAETTGVVTANATQAATGAAASQAGIPIIGPALAMAAAASMMAFVSGMGGGGGTSTTVTRIPMGGSVPSAARGYDIPAGVNPLTQLHEREMVLPQPQADAVRQMAEGGGASGGPIVINATGGDFIHKRDLAQLLRTMKRDFRFG